MHDEEALAIATATYEAMLEAVIRDAANDTATLDSLAGEKLAVEQQGEDAAEVGGLPSDNPYGPETPQGSQWLTGWLKGREAKSGEQKRSR